MQLVHGVNMHATLQLSICVLQKCSPKHLGWSWKSFKIQCSRSWLESFLTQCSTVGLTPQLRNTWEPSGDGNCGHPSTSSQYSQLNRLMWLCISSILVWKCNPNQQQRRCAMPWPGCSLQQAWHPLQVLHW